MIKVLTTKYVSFLQKENIFLVPSDIAEHFYKPSMKTKLSKEMQRCVPGARLWIDSSSSAFTFWTCWTFQLSKEWYQSALDTKAAQMPLGNALSAVASSSVQMKQTATKRYQQEVWEGLEDPSIVAVPRVAGLGKVILPQVYIIIFFSVFVCLFVLISFPQA